MFSFHSALKLKVLASSQGQLVYRQVHNGSRPWQLLTFPPTITAEVVDCMETAARICPLGLELLVVVPGADTMLHSAVQRCEHLVFLADPLYRVHRALSVQKGRSHAESFLLNAKGVLQLTLVHRLPGPALRSMADLLSLLLAHDHMADHVAPAFNPLRESEAQQQTLLDRVAAEVP